MPFYKDPRFREDDKKEKIPTTTAEIFHNTVPNYLITSATIFATFLSRADGTIDSGHTSST